MKFKDGKELRYSERQGVEGSQGEEDLNEVKIADVVEQVDRHSRLLKRKDELDG